MAGTAASDHSTPFDKQYENTAGILADPSGIQSVPVKTLRVLLRKTDDRTGHIHPLVFRFP